VSLTQAARNKFAFNRWYHLFPALICAAACSIQATASRSERAGHPRLKILALCKEIFVAADQFMCQRRKMDARLQTVLEIMNADLHQKLTLHDLALSVNISRSHLSLLFKVQLGMPPGKYLIALRVHRAHRLLATTLLSVKQVMAQVGYSDKGLFTRHFKRAYGVTPSEYAAKHRDPNLVKNRQARQDLKIV
jgi:AraC-like DNA-binding protein